MPSANYSILYFRYARKQWNYIITKHIITTNMLNDQRKYAMVSCKCRTDQGDSDKQLFGSNFHICTSSQNVTLNTFEIS